MQPAPHRNPNFPLKNDIRKPHAVSAVNPRRSLHNVLTSGNRGFPKPRLADRPSFAAIMSSRSQFVYYKFMPFVS